MPQVRISEEGYSLLRQLSIILNMQMKQVVELSIRILSILADIAPDRVRELYFVNDRGRVLLELRKMLGVSAVARSTMRNEIRRLFEELAKFREEIYRELHQVKRRLEEQEKRSQASTLVTSQEEARALTSQVEAGEQSRVQEASSGIDLESNPWVQIIRSRYVIERI